MWLLCETEDALNKQHMWVCFAFAFFKVSSKMWEENSDSNAVLEKEKISFPAVCSHATDCHIHIFLQ